MRPLGASHFSAYGTLYKASTTHRRWEILKIPRWEKYTPGSSSIAGWKMDPKWVDVFPIEHGDIPASYVSLPEGNFPFFRSPFWKVCGSWALENSIWIDANLPFWNFTLPETTTVRPWKWMVVSDDFPFWGCLFAGVNSLLVSGAGYPFPAKVSMLHQFLEWGPGPSSPTPVESFENEQPMGERRGFWIFELGTHRALSSEPVVTWSLGLWMCSELLSWESKVPPQEIRL